MDYYELSLHRRQQIEEGLLELLRTNPYEKVTVTDIAAHMHMSRKSFYKYFSGKDDCLVSLFDRVIQEAALHVASCSHASGDSPDLWQEYLLFWKKQHPLLDMVENQKLEPVFIRRHLHYNLTEERYNPMSFGFSLPYQDDDAMVFYMTGIIALLMSWCRRGFTPSPGEMAKKLANLVPFRPNEIQEELP